MNICIVSVSLHTHGGAQRVVIDDANYFVSKGHDVSVLSGSIDSSVISSYGLRSSVTTYEYSIGNSFLPEFYPRVREIRGLLDDIKPDAVIVHYQEVSTWLALATLTIDPVLTTHIHGSLFWFKDNPRRSAHMRKNCARKLTAEVPGHGEFWSIEEPPLHNKIKYSTKERVQKIALQDYDGIFVNTRQVSRELNCLYNAVSDVNPPGVSIKKVEDTDQSDVSIESPYILSISRLDPRKRIGLLIRAFAELRTYASDLRLVIGGTGEQESYLQELAIDLDVENQVEFLGHVPEESLPHYYSEAEIFACPGWMSYGLTPLEAIQFQTKVALSTDTFAKEVIGDQKGVQVIPPEKDEWVHNLRGLLNSSNSPSPDAVPTSQQHSEKKLDFFRRN